MGYRYDDLLGRHFQKHAFWGAAARVGLNAARGAANFGKGFMGFGGALGKSGIVGKGLNAAGIVAGVAAPIIGSVMPGSPNAGPQISAGPFTLGGGRTTTASLREKPAVFRTKAADWKSVVTPVSYAAMLGGALAPFAIDAHKHPTLARAAHYGPEIAGLLGLGAVTGSDISQGKDVSRNLLDAAGLGLFTAAAGHRAWKPPADH